MRVLKIMVATIISLVTIVIALVIFLFAVSHGKALPFRDENGEVVKGSISEKIFVIINGFNTGMFIKGIDSTKPVLLFIHGGPGMPEYAISREYEQVLEKHFVVCWPEQRGAGMSYKSEIDISSLTFETAIEDIIATAKYLKQKFGKDKIYLMAHSGGTFAAIQAADRAQELFHAYIAVSQISNQLKSEKMAYKYMIEQFTEANDKKTLRKFSPFSPENLDNPKYYVMRDAPMHKLGIGTTREMKSVVKGVFIPVMLCREYTLKEKINIWRGKYLITAKAGLWSKLVKTDLKQKVTELKIPIYFFGGKYDYTTSSSLAREYFMQIEAPLKGFYTFENSAHSPIFEEPLKAEDIIVKDVLNNELKHADH